MLKKNIAKAMAAATVISAAVPMTQVLAAPKAVIDNGQTEEIKAIKEKAAKLINLKFTNKANKLHTPGNAGSKVFGSISVGSQVCTNYADFEKAFDAKYASLEEGQKLTVSYNLASGIYAYTELEDGTVVDFVPSKYIASDFDSASEKDERTDVAGDIVKITAEDGSKTYQMKLSTTAEDTAKSETRYMDIKVGDNKLDPTKPILRTAKNHYVNLAGDAILPVQNTHTTTINASNEGEVAGSGVTGFVIDGFELDSLSTEKVEPTNDVIVKQGYEVIEMTSTEMFNSEEGRFTREGNEVLRRTLGLTVQNINDMTYRVNTSKSIESSFGKEFKIVIEGKNTIDANADFATVVELIVKKDDNDIKGASYSAIKDMLSGDTEDYIVTAAGNDRYETAVEASKKHWSNWDGTTGGAKQVVLVSGASEALVDGLTAAPLSAVLNSEQGAPILLTKKDEIPEVVLNELKRLGTEDVFIVGGTNSVDKTVETTLEQKYGYNVTRLDGGEDGGRYETSLAVANEIVKQRSTDLTEVFVVGGNGEADALSISAVAAIKKSPILLTQQSKLNTGVELFIKDNDLNDVDGTKQITVVGGKNSVSEETYNSLLSLDKEIERLAGDTRQDTNAKVLARYNSGSKTIVMAKSDNKGMVDALGAGAIAGKLRNVSLVLATNELTLDQKDALININVADRNNNKIEVGDRKSVV